MIVIPQPYVFLGLSNDGSLALFQTFAQDPGSAFLAATSTGQLTQLTLPDNDQPAAGTISGDSSVVFIATTSGSILKFHTANLAQAPDVLVPHTPDVGHDHQFTIGSLLRLNGFLPGTNSQLQGRITLDGRPLPILLQDSSGVTIQVPWEQQPAAVPLRLDFPTESPFMQFELVIATWFFPMFEIATGASTAAAPIQLIKGDFSGLVTEPPQPGDIVITYMTGIGPVVGQPQTAVPAPLSPLLPLNGHLSCTFSPQQSAAETLFVGLAPGLIGTYQVTFRMPADAGQGRISSVNCLLTTPLGTASFGIFTLRVAP